MTARPPALLARFARARRGATAVEFALVAGPFFFLLFGIIELALIFLLSTTLDNALAGAARQVRTGELQLSGRATSAIFSQKVCQGMGWLENECAANLKVDVRVFSKFSDVSAGSPLTNGAMDTKKLCFAVGGPGDIVLTRAFYQWRLMTPMLGSVLENMANGKRLVSSVATFRNEPYGDPVKGAPTC